MNSLTFIFVATVATFSSVSGDDTSGFCPPGYSITERQWCYWAPPGCEKMGWYDVMELCEENNGHMVEINSLLEGKALAGFINDHFPNNVSYDEFWIGMAGLSDGADKRKREANIPYQCTLKPEEDDIVCNYPGVALPICEALPNCSVVPPFVPAGDSYFELQMFSPHDYDLSTVHWNHGDCMVDPFGSNTNCVYNDGATVTAGPDANGVTTGTIESLLFSGDDNVDDSTNIFLVFSYTYGFGPAINASLTGINDEDIINLSLDTTGMTNWMIGCFNPALGFCSFEVLNYPATLNGQLTEGAQVYCTEGFTGTC